MNQTEQIRRNRLRARAQMKAKGRLSHDYPDVYQQYYREALGEFYAADYADKEKEKA